jgi:hypothetical protein
VSSVRSICCDVVDPAVWQLRGKCVPVETA